MHCIEDGTPSSKAFILLLFKATVCRPQGKKPAFSLLCQTVIPTTDETIAQFSHSFQGFQSVSKQTVLRPFLGD